MSQRILLTGAGGFVGPYVIRALKSQGHQAIYASVYSPTSDLSLLLSKDHILPGDLTNFGYASSLLKISKPDIIYHLAGLSAVESSVEETTRLITNNTLLTYNLLEATRQTSPKARVLIVSSGNVYGQVSSSELPIKETVVLRPQNAYAVSKISSEYLGLEYHYAHGLDVVVLRPFNHTGPGQPPMFVVPSLAKQIVAIKRRVQPPVLKVGNLATARDFTDVRDMAAAYLLAASRCASGEVYNIGSGTAYSVQEIVTRLESLAKIRITLQADASKVRAKDIPLLLADTSKFYAATAWRPAINFEQTLADVLQYFEETTQ